MSEKIIVFDFGNVLIRWDPHVLYGPYFNDYAKERYFLDVVCNKQWNESLDRGHSFEESIEERIFLFPEYEVPIRMYKDNWFDMCSGEIEENVAFVQSLIRDGREFFGLSNFSNETLRGAEDRFPILKEFRNRRLISADVGFVKPEIEIYLHFFRKFKLNPEDCFFIDDSRANIEMAKRLGMDGLVFNEKRL